MKEESRMLSDEFNFIVLTPTPFAKLPVGPKDGTVVFLSDANYPVNSWNAGPTDAGGGGTFQFLVIWRAAKGWWSGIAWPSS
jgi:hypothetical protein